MVHFQSGVCRRSLYRDTEGEMPESDIPAGMRRKAGQRVAFAKGTDMRCAVPAGRLAAGWSGIG